MSWKPSFDFATLYSNRVYDLKLFRLNCVCKNMPLNGSQFTKGDKCLYRVDGDWVNVIKVGGTFVSTYGLEEFRNYFKWSK